SAGPHEVDIPREGGVGDRQFPERQAFRPWRRPVRHERHPQTPINHGCDRLKRFEFEPFTWPNAGSAQIAVDELSPPGLAVVSDEWLRCQDDVWIAHGC